VLIDKKGSGIDPVNAPIANLHAMIAKALQGTGLWHR
jgi:hypothetical protein